MMLNRKSTFLKVNAGKRKAVFHPHFNVAIKVNPITNIVPASILIFKKISISVDIRHIRVK